MRPLITETFPMLATADLNRAIGFYRDLLGFHVSYRFPVEGEPVFVTLTAGDTTLGIGAESATRGRARDTGVFSLCAYVADLDAALDRLRAAAVTILSEPVDQPWGERMAEIADPDGVRIVLMSSMG